MYICKFSYNENYFWLQNMYKNFINSNFNSYGIKKIDIYVNKYTNRNNAYEYNVLYRFYDNIFILV